ncbi:MAG: M48 family metalloprotease [Planctomycetota bacterium]|nr:M48 family metalloprotease [Planctomycetota bacterium]
MSEFDASVRRIAIQIGINDPVAVSSDFENSSVRVGYSFTGRSAIRTVNIQFGAMVSILSMCELDALIAHEFAHVVAGHTSRLGFRSLHAIQKLPPSPVRTFFANLVVTTLRYKSFWLGRQREFAADKIACGKVSALSLACVLVKTAAFENAIDELWSHKTIGGYTPVFESKSIQPRSRFPNGLSSLEILQVISDSFEMNIDAFRSCSKMAKQLDSSTRDHPSNHERLERIGLDWNTAEAKCVFAPEKRLDFNAFRKWICESKNKIIATKANNAMDAKGSVTAR